MALFNGDVVVLPTWKVLSKNIHTKNLPCLFIDLLGPPTITHISDNQTASEGEKVMLNCTADGNPPPNITWTRLSSNSHVTFPMVVSKSDKGGYRCTADNGIANKSHDVFITVQCKSD